MRISTSPGVVVGESPEEEFREETTVGPISLVILAVLEAPRSQVGGSEVGGEEAIAAGEANGIGEDGSGDCVTWAETRTWSGFFGLFGL